MISWKEYIENSILVFRKRYKKLPSKQKELVKKNEIFFLETLNKPCQVVVIDFRKPHSVSFIILHDKERPDMEIVTLEDVALKDFSLKTLEQVEMLKTLGDSEIREISEAIEKVTPQISEYMWEIASKHYKKSFLVWFSKDPRGKELWAWELWHFMYLTTENNISDAFGRRKIEETVEDIKKDASTIEEPDLRTRIIEKTEKLESHVAQLGEQHRKLREEVVGVRKLVGTKTFGEWKILLSEIDKMNTRIDSLSDIRSAYDKVLAQQAEVMKQQSSFIKWIKYATILLPIAVVSVPVIEIISILIRHSLGIP